MNELVVDKKEGAAIRRNGSPLDGEDCLGNAIKRHRHRNAVLKLSAEVRTGGCPAAANRDPGSDLDLGGNIPEDPDMDEMRKVAIVEIADGQDGHRSG